MNILAPDRLAAVRDTQLLDTAAEEVFDRLTRLAVRLVGIPAAFISLVDANRDFYKSACGFGEPLATTRELAGLTFCHYTVQNKEPLIIPDTAADPVYRNVPTVKSLGVAAYVGVPLVINGQVVGAFCTIDTKPRDWTAGEIEVLTELAASAQREIELRMAVVASLADKRLLELNATELRSANKVLQEQTQELEAQTAELQATTAHLEELTDEAMVATRLTQQALDDAIAARAEAESANRVKAEFLAVMSHELRTPLNAIGGYSDLIEMGVHGPVTEGQLGALARIKRSQTHLLGLINGLLTYAQLDAGAVSFEIEDVDIDAVINTCEALTSPQAVLRGITLEKRAPDGSIKVKADQEKLHQIVVNLVSNAVKFTDGGGTVAITSHSGEDGNARIEVSDTGRGIPYDQLERIFEPFVQVDAKLTRAKEGTGLGLSISRTLARGMHGDIKASSKVGVGSTFTLTLPLARGNSEPLQPR
ncbi:MAG TPA: GAF domain-containing sensor histidine kinase [Gemmatimonadaceae bacterium]|nr:GAF domain-containing sensor histidine kinase [Gemmatimonadaceae bacterium]